MEYHLAAIIPGIVTVLLLVAGYIFLNNQRKVLDVEKENKAKLKENVNQLTVENKKLREALDLSKEVVTSLQKQIEEKKKSSKS